MKQSDEAIVMAEHICQICNKTHTHNTEILLHKQLRAIPKDKRLTGYSLCAEHAKLFEDGYVALVGCDESKSTFLKNGNMDPAGAYRSGDIMHIKRSIWNDIFDMPVDEKQEFVFCDEDAIHMLRERMPQE